MADQNRALAFTYLKVHNRTSRTVAVPKASGWQSSAAAATDDIASAMAPITHLDMAAILGFILSVHI